MTRKKLQKAFSDRELKLSNLLKLYQLDNQRADQDISSGPAETDQVEQDYK